MADDPGNPAGLYRISPDVPQLDGLSDLVMLYHLDGFIDAGGAGRLLAEHLLSSLDHTEVARFDLDALIDYRSRRPVMTFAKDRWDSYDGPELVAWLLDDATGTPFLLLNGLEPDHHWNAFTTSVMSLATELRVRLAVGFHGIPMGIPHTRPAGVTAHMTRPGLVEHHRPLVDRLQVPGSAAALLEYRMGSAGQDAIGFAVHVPHYLASASYPAAAVKLLESVQRATGLTLPGDALREAAQNTDEELARQVEGSEDIAEVVQALEHQYDLFASSARGSLLADDAEPMPTAEELGAQFEQFLADQQDRGGDYTEE